MWPFSATPPAQPERARVLLVTGASSGIGRAVALAAAGRGDHLVLAARDEGSLKLTAEECDAAGAASTTVVPGDVGSDADVERWVGTTVDRHGRLDAVAHCAGVVAYGRAEDVPPEVFDRVLRTNLTGSINVARHVVRQLRRQRRGNLVLVGSVIGHIAAPGMTPYAVSKWGVRSLARQLQIENRDQAEVHISYVAPGGVLTPIYEGAANYNGWAGRPPPPVDRPEKVARAILELFDTPQHRRQVGVANGVIRFGFSMLPGVYDVLVGPLFKVAATDLTSPQPPTTGNVLDPRPELHRLYGHQVSAVRGVARNVAGLVRPAGGGA
jgi:NAD(P)-dependent dehydrogenase (short-subunit alcohol dehydrogenase family)